MLARALRVPDVRVGLGFLLGGLVMFVGALQIDRAPGSASVIGPAVFPMVISLAMIACSLALVVTGARSPDSADTEEEVVSPDHEETTADEMAGLLVEPPVDRRRVLVTFVLFVAYVVAYIPLGFVVSTILFLVALPTYIQPDKWLRNTSFAIGFAGLTYLLFNYVLEVALPNGNLLGG